MVLGEQHNSATPFTGSLVSVLTLAVDSSTKRFLLNSQFSVPAVSCCLCFRSHAASIPPIIRKLVICSVQVEVEIEVYKDTRGCSALLSDDGEILALKKTSSRKNASALSRDSRTWTSRTIMKKMVMTCSSLPDEMIFEILSWLPVKSLLRFKCICKMWCSKIEDPRFVELHRSRAPYITGAFKKQCSEFTVIRQKGGLLLEKNVLTNAYRLRNLATRQILDLPSPREQTGTCVNICYIPATNDLKVIYLHYLEEARLVYDVLRVGVGQYLTWKRVDSPSLCIRKKLWPVTVTAGTVFYCLNEGLMGERFLDCIDLENDQIKSTIRIPDNLFLEWKNIIVSRWNGKPCLARIEQERLKVWVLEKYNKHEFVDSKIIIPLKFMKDYPSMSMRKIVPQEMVGGRIFWSYQDGDYCAIFSFDIESNEVKFLLSMTMTMTNDEKLEICHYKPDLLHFKGMSRDQRVS